MYPDFSQYFGHEKKFHIQLSKKNNFCFFGLPKQNIILRVLESELSRSPKIVEILSNRREMGTITKTHIYNCSKRILEDPKKFREINSFSFKSFFASGLCGVWSFPKYCGNT